MIRTDPAVTAWLAAERARIAARIAADRKRVNR